MSSSTENGRRGTEHGRVKRSEAEEGRLWEDLFFFLGLSPRVSALGSQQRAASSEQPAASSQLSASPVEDALRSMRGKRSLLHHSTALDSLRLPHDCQVAVGRALGNRAATHATANCRLDAEDESAGRGRLPHNTHTAVRPQSSVHSVHGPAYMVLRTWYIPSSTYGGLGRSISCTSSPRDLDSVTWEKYSA